jgi:NDP-sugar pyrophosphorylase family protein
MVTGIHIMEPRILEYVPRGVFSDSVTDVYPKAMANGEILGAHVASGKWRELSTLKRYLDISVELLREEGKSLVAGTNASISPAATVTESVLWDNVEVSAGARVNRAVLADKVKIGANEVIENAVVVPRRLIEGKKPPEKALSGHFQGESFIVPL